MPRTTPFLLLSSSLCLLFGCPAGDDTETGADGSTTASDGSGTGEASDGTTADTATADETGEPIDGEEQYLAFCAPCHGTGGEGTALGYELRHPVRDYSTWVVRNGRPGTEFMGTSSMAAYDSSLLSDAALEAIWDFLDGFPQPTTGEGLYLDYCRNCHGVDATGGPTGVNISEETPADILDKVREGEAVDFSMRSLYMPAFDAARLSDAEVQLVIDYIAGL